MLYQSVFSEVKDAGEMRQFAADLAFLIANDFDLTVRVCKRREKVLKAQATDDGLSLVVHFLSKGRDHGVWCFGFLEIAPDTFMQGGMAVAPSWLARHWVPPDPFMSGHLPEEWTRIDRREIVDGFAD